jgi:RHS repeat-associated protein
MFASRIGTRSESAGGEGFAEAYGYELSGRLDTVHRGGALVSDYGFDTNGNRLSHRIGAASPLRDRVWPCLGDLAGTAEVTVAGGFDAQDRMQSYGTCQYEYTRNGELTRRIDSASGAVTNYQYDEFGNLRRVDLADARVVTYHIDGLNRRVGKSIDGVRQWGLLYASQLEPVAELDGAGNIVASFLYADRPHVPSLMLKGGHTYRILSDHLGSVRLVIDLADGSIAQRLAYDEYGNIVEDTNPGFQPFAYAGGLYDRDTGLTRFGARDYDAVAGRWTAKDRLNVISAYPNRYYYCGDDPINLLDINGEVYYVIAVAAIAIGVGWYIVDKHVISPSETSEHFAEMAQSKIDVDNIDKEIDRLNDMLDRCLYNECTAEEQAMCSDGTVEDRILELKKEQIGEAWQAGEHAKEAVKSNMPLPSINDLSKPR